MLLVKDPIPTKVVPGLTAWLAAASVFNPPLNIALSHVHWGRSVIKNVDSSSSFLGCRDQVDSVIVPRPHLTACGNYRHGSSPSSNENLVTAPLFRGDFWRAEAYRDSRFASYRLVHATHPPSPKNLAAHSHFFWPPANPVPDRGRPWAGNKVPYRP